MLKINLNQQTQQDNNTNATNNNIINNFNYIMTRM